MPGFNGTGPEGKGPKTGRGEGLCGTNNESKNTQQANDSNEVLGLGRGGRPRGGGRGRGFGGGRRKGGWRNWFGRNRNTNSEDDK